MKEEQVKEIIESIQTKKKELDKLKKYKSDLYTFFYSLGNPELDSPSILTSCVEEALHYELTQYMYDSSFIDDEIEILETSIYREENLLKEKDKIIKIDISRVPEDFKDIVEKEVEDLVSKYAMYVKIK